MMRTAEGIFMMIYMFLKACLRCDGIPFDLYRRPNEETREALAEVRRMEEHPEQYKGYTDVDEMFREMTTA